NKKSSCNSRHDFLKKTASGSFALFGSQKVFLEKKRRALERAVSSNNSRINPEATASKEAIFSESNRKPGIHFSSIVINHTCPFVSPAMDDDYVKKLQEGGITLAMSTVASIHQFRGAIDQIIAFYERLENDNKLLFITQVDDIYRAKKEKKSGCWFSFSEFTACGVRYKASRYLL
ncbi:unnamed protein product, partial [marine sediment metagenome]